MKLQERDLNLMQNLSRFGVMSTRQIAETLFASVAMTTVLKRLRILEDSKFIFSCGHLSDGSKVWSLAKEGGRTINANEIFYYKNQNTIQHDVCLTGARLALETIGLGTDWTSEAELKQNQGYYHRGGIVPDGIFTSDVFNQAQVVAFELELSPKSHLRYKKIFQEYRRLDAIGVIWYVLRDKSIAKPIIKQWQSRINKTTQTLLFAQLDDLLTNRENTRITSPDGTSWPLNQVFKLEKLHQGVSSLLSQDQSTQLSGNSMSNQQFTSAPEFPKSVPSALDPSLSTFVLEEGVEAYRHR